MSKPKLKPFDPPIDEDLILQKIDTWPKAKHRFDSESIWAIRAALAGRRPLLIQGEPGIGKSQLARAVAQSLEIPFMYHVIDERSERDDLLYAYDAVSRLSQAQIAAHQSRDKSWRRLSWDQAIAEDRFIKPGILWWAFNWEEAERQLRKYFRKLPLPDKQHKGWSQTAATHWETGANCVVLIDEIDKADPSVPNGLLESLGNAGFHTAQLGRSVSLAKDTAPPLVIITTNGERELPAAFLRRCLVYDMEFPPPNKTVELFLLERARIYWSPQVIEDDICKAIIEQLLKDRETAKQGGFAKPGAAEFLDILNILGRLYPGEKEAQSEALTEIHRFALEKSPLKDDGN